MRQSSMDRCIPIARWVRSKSSLTTNRRELVFCKPSGRPMKGCGLRVGGGARHGRLRRRLRLATCAGVAGRGARGALVVHLRGAFAAVWGSHRGIDRSPRARSASRDHRGSRAGAGSRSVPLQTFPLIRRDADLRGDRDDRGPLRLISRRCSNTSRTARSRTSGAYLLDVLDMTPSSQVSRLGACNFPGAVQSVAASTVYAALLVVDLFEPENLDPSRGRLVRARRVRIAVGRRASESPIVRCSASLFAC